MISLEDLNENKNVNRLIKWFTDKINLLGKKISQFKKNDNLEKINSTNVQNYRTVRGFNADSIGKLYLYVYDPKHKDVLPKYDTFPLIILVDLNQKGFVGLNLHYLPALQRLNILNKLLENNKEINEKTRIRLNYGMLKSASFLSPLKECYKNYLFDHVKSGFLEVPVEEWAKVVLLPIENFKHNTKKG